MGGGNGYTIKASPGIYGGMAATPPGEAGPPPGPVPVPDGSPTGIAGAAAAFAANSGVPGDVESSTLEDLDRRTRALEAARKFPAQDADGAQQMQGVGAQAGEQQATQMMQQMLSSITGAIGGAVGGIMKPLTEIPQQAMQAGQGAMQPLMSALQQGPGTAGLASEEHLIDNVGAEPGLGGSGGAGGGGLGAGGGGIGAGGGGGTVPAGYMGPPPVPTSSPPTTPAGASAKVVTATPTGAPPAASGPTGMTGMPMVPPGAMGAGGAGENKDKAAEKRVTAPAVPNGQPVKGRLTPPPNVPVAKSGEDKPPVVTRSPRRIVIMPSDEERKD
jgi:hypothetical protein